MVIITDIGLILLFYDWTIYIGNKLTLRKPYLVYVVP